MPKQISTVAPDPILTNLVIEYGSGGGYIADDLFPIFMPLKEEGKYAKYNREELKQDIETLRAIGAVAHQVDFDMSYETCSCEERALMGLLADRIMNNASNPEALRRRRVKILNAKIRLGVETRIKTLVNDETVIANAVPGIKWDGSTPTIEQDIDAAKEEFVLACGMEPNRIVIPSPVAKVVKRDPTIRELSKYTQSNLLVNGDLPPSIFNLKILIPGTIEDVSNPGTAENIARVWNQDNVILAYVDLTATDGETLTAGIQIQAKTLAGKQATIAKTWREDKVDGEYFQVQKMTEEVIVAKECLYILKDVLT